MSQPPSDQDRPPDRDRSPDRDQPPSRPAGNRSSPWPSGNEPMTWPSGPAGNEPPSWPAGPGQDQGQGEPPSWPSANQSPAWPSPGRSSPPPPPLPSPAWPAAGQPPSGPGYTYGYGPRRPRFRRRFPIRALIVLGLFIAFGFAVRGLTSHHEPVSATVSPPASVGLHTGLQAPPGAVGATFTLDDGTGSAYRVTLVKTIDPARGADQAGPPDSGKRFVGLVFTIRALSGDLQGEDANNDAVLVGAGGQKYPAALSGIAGYTNFNHGAIQAAPGETVTGAVAFQVPDGVTVSTIQWTALSGFGPMAEWTVTG
jgi:hypothetical protein